MNKHYHYFVVKTLAHYAGLTEQEAQTVAFYSQQVDDHIINLPMCVDGEPPSFFQEQGYAKKLAGDYWLVLPHPTGINVVLTINEHYQKSTLAAFHFIPGKPFSQIDRNPDFSRADYRCLPADDNKADLIMQIVQEAVELTEKDRSDRNLMRLGMALHTYADTFAHCGFSGLDGWENHASIKKAYNQMTGKEEVSELERSFYETLPAIGHGRVGHVPDICVYDVDMSSRQNGKTSDPAPDIVRKNNEWFMKISKMIFLLLCRVAGAEEQGEERWEKLSGELSQAMMVSSKDETDTKRLVKHWKEYFPQLCYEYQKDGRFYKDDHSVQEELGRIVYHVSEEFYIYNELAYQRAEIVLGTNDALQEHKDMLLQESVDSPAMLTSFTREQRSLSANSLEDNLPKTELGLAVYTAGFEYDPERDIICSTMNNMQRLAGYCWAYDEAAVMISSMIDCEPIYFRYGGYDWLIELWKGQYGIETGCEIGLYYHKTRKKSSDGQMKWEMFGCVDDEHMLDMAFALERNGEELFAREWTRHWWLTGFRWGEISKPEELTMKTSIRFPNGEMLQAFINGGMEKDAGRTKGRVYGLKAMGYPYTLTGENEISFLYQKPVTKQPELRTLLGKAVLDQDRKMVDEYNSIKKKLGIEGNDPDVIGTTLTEKGGEEEKHFYKLLVKLISQKRTTLLECKGGN